MKFSFFADAAILQYLIFAQVNGAALPTIDSGFDFASLAASGFPSGIPSGVPSGILPLPKGGKGNTTHSFPKDPRFKGNGTHPHRKGNGTHPEGKTGFKNNRTGDIPFLSQSQFEYSASADLTSLTFAAESATATA